MTSQRPRKQRLQYPRSEGRYKLPALIVIRACGTSTLTQLGKIYEPHTGLQTATSHQQLTPFANAVANSLIPNSNKNLVDPQGPLVKTCGLRICALAHPGLTSQSGHQGGVHSSKANAPSWRGTNTQAVRMHLDFAKRYNTKMYQQVPPAS